MTRRGGIAIGGRTVVLVALGVLPAIVFSSALVVPIWLAVVAVAVGVDLALAADPRALRFTRELPERVRLGERVDGRLVVVNDGRRRLRGVVRDAWDPTANAQPSRMRMDVPAGERRTTPFALVPERRGERRSVGIAVRAAGPLGLASRQRLVDAPGRIRVLAPFASRRHLPSRVARLRELDGSASVMVRGQGTEFDSLREYVRGDDVRSIDWRASARSRDLVVRTWRPERDRRVVLVIDSGRTAAARVGEETRFDAAVEAALLTAALADRAGDRVSVVVWDRRLRARVTGARGADLLSRTVDVLADVDPDLVETDWAGIPAIVQSLTSRRALVVLLTSADSVAAAGGLVDAVPQLARKHSVLVAGVRDPELAAAVADRGDVERVWLAGAAGRAQLDRERLDGALARLGAGTVVAEPTDLAPALADRYLALKRAGLL